MFHENVFQDGTPTRFGLWGCGSHFQNGRHDFSMSRISANTINRKLIIVSMSMFSESRNANMAIILVCGGGGGAVDMHFQCPISRRII